MPPRSKPPPRPQTPTERLRAGVVESVESQRALAQRAEVDPGTISRFANGGPIGSETFDRLAGVLGYELVPTARTRRRG